MESTQMWFEKIPACFIQMVCVQLPVPVCVAVCSKLWPITS